MKRYVRSASEFTSQSEFLEYQNQIIDELQARFPDLKFENTTYLPYPKFEVSAYGFNFNDPIYTMSYMDIADFDFDELVEHIEGRVQNVEKYLKTNKHQNMIHVLKELGYKYTPERIVSDIQSSVYKETFKSKEEADNYLQQFYDICSELNIPGAEGRVSRSRNSYWPYLVKIRVRK